MPGGSGGGVMAAAVATAASMALLLGDDTRGTMSIRKSYTSLSPTAACRSCLCSVLRRFLSVCLQALNEMSLINSSQALLISTGASPEIINFRFGRTISDGSAPSSSAFWTFSFSSSLRITSSLFIIFLILASGNVCIFQFSVAGSMLLMPWTDCSHISSNPSSTWPIKFIDDMFFLLLLLRTDLSVSPLNCEHQLEAQLH
mmetsp:Transcript_126184/g.365197  ORF Transcript_126184/g.365197 Transcript_126184/m.365197 type:complete len:201 (-) Transcript_126184:99-701(-)